MSWDYNEYDIPCHCGKGLVHVKHGSNDWGQTSHHETILCNECREKEEEKERIHQAKERKSAQQKRQVMDYFRDHYEGVLQQKFENAKTKKNYWEIATSLKLEILSLSSFYSRCKSPEDYVCSFIQWDYIEKLIVALKISDNNLQGLIDEAKPLDDELHSIWLAQAYHDITGK